jgi:hypothetical protein
VSTLLLVVTFGVMAAAARAARDHTAPSPNLTDTRVHASPHSTRMPQTYGVRHRGDLASDANSFHRGIDSK